jgi:hypothetical protein
MYAQGLEGGVSPTKLRSLLYEALAQKTVDPLLQEAAHAPDNQLHL